MAIKCHQIALVNRIEHNQPMSQPEHIHDSAPQERGYHYGDLRNTLILKGLAMLNSKGAENLSLRELARDIGVGHNAPYRHFRNKNELLEAIAATGFRQLKAYNLRLELEHAGDAESQLMESALYLIQLAGQQKNLFRLMFGGQLSLFDCGEELRREAQETLQSLVKIITLGQQQGRFSKEHGLCQTLGTLSMIQGFALMTSSGLLQEIPQDQQQLRAMAVQVVDVLLKGLRLR